MARMPPRHKKLWDAYAMADKEYLPWKKRFETKPNHLHASLYDVWEFIKEDLKKIPEATYLYKYIKNTLAEEWFETNYHMVLEEQVKEAWARAREIDARQDIT